MTSQALIRDIRRLCRQGLVLLGLAVPPAPADDILDAASGRAVDRPELLARLGGADYLLLGEVHDNPRHHRARAELLRALPAGFRTVVLEQLDRGTRLDPALPLDAALDKAGFDGKGWQWPLHEPVFGAARERGMHLLGGNLGRKEARRVAMEGEPALDDGLSRLLARSPLSEAARQGLDADLSAGHCGRLPDARLPNLRLAQRARDAALASTLLETGGGPAILLAGNGHVRRDYGVPVLLACEAPRARVVSIGFMELAAGERPDAEAWRGVYDYLWFTPAAERDDPCAGLRMP
jgi:uncharacterized iron-regulated protein